MTNIVPLNRIFLVGNVLWFRRLRKRIKSMYVAVIATV